MRCCARLARTCDLFKSFQTFKPFNPDSVVQSDAAITRQALQSECNGSAACSGLQSPVLQRTSGKITSPGPSTLDSIEIVRFCAFAPPGSPLDLYILLSSLTGFSEYSNCYRGARFIAPNLQS
jgi:hypothetical protein